MRVLLSLSKFFMHRLLIVIGQMNLDYLLFSLACSQVTQLNIYVGMFQPQEGFQVTQPGQTQLYMFRGGKESKNSSERRDIIIVIKITDTFHTVGINSFSMYRYLTTAP